MEGGWLKCGEWMDGDAIDSDLILPKQVCSNRDDRLFDYIKAFFAVSVRLC